MCDECAVRDDCVYYKKVIAPAVKKRAAFAARSGNPAAIGRAARPKK
jgi:hypothetical protein